MKLIIAILFVGLLAVGFEYRGERTQRVELEWRLKQCNNPPQQRLRGVIDTVLRVEPTVGVTYSDTIPVDSLTDAEIDSILGGVGDEQNK